MAKFKFSNADINRITDNINKRFDEFTSDTKELTKASEIVLREIKANTRQGKGFDGESFPSLAASTIENRKRYAAVNNTSRFYSASTSNATFIGDTIDNIKAKVSSGIITLFGEGNHSRVAGIRVPFLKGSDASISDILAGLTKRGWKILGVSEKAKQQIRIQFIRFIRRKL